MRSLLLLALVAGAAQAEIFPAWESAGDDLTLSDEVHGERLRLLKKYQADRGPQLCAVSLAKQRPASLGRRYTRGRRAAAAAATGSAPEAVACAAVSER